MGFVGEPSFINPDLFMLLEETEIIPVIAPIGYGNNNETYNINADTATGAIASALAAKKAYYVNRCGGCFRQRKKACQQSIC